MPDLVVQAPYQGIAPSPHKGFGDMRNLDIWSSPGVTKLNTILEKKSSTTVDAQVKWMVKNPASPANLYALDSNGSVYTSSNSGTSWSELSDREGAGQGIAVFKDHLIVAEGDKLDAYGPLSGTPAWTNDWVSLTTDSLWQPMLVSKLDGKLYIGNGRYVDSIKEVDGQDFDPDSGGTYTHSQGSAGDTYSLDLPEGYRVKCLAELGNNLMVGTWMGTAVYDNMIADIFPWDGSSTTYYNPVQINENGINAMINIGGNLYIMAGINGVVYKSNGVQAWPIAEIPNSVADISGGKYIEPYPDAMMSLNGRLYFALSSSTTNDLEVRDGVGVYSLTETNNGTIVDFEHAISTGTMGSSNPTVIGSLLAITRDVFIAGFRDNATYGIDMLSSTSYAYGTDYSGYFESPFYQVGSYLDKTKFDKMEFYLSKELAASEGIRIKFRVNLTDDWTTLGTYTTTEIGTGLTSYHEQNINIPECEQIQIRVELLGTSTTTPEFKYLIFK